MMLPNEEWFELKGRLFRFLGTHPGWVRWRAAVGNDDGVWMCSQEKDRAAEAVRATRVAAVVHDTKMIHSRAIPEQHAVADVTAQGWNRLLMGIFSYLGGPARLDDITTICAAAMRMPGTKQMETGVAVAFPGEGHLSYEEMDASVEGQVAEHAGCDFCARQVASYLSGAERVSLALVRPGPVGGNGS